MFSILFIYSFSDTKTKIHTFFPYTKIVFVFVNSFFSLFQLLMFCVLVVAIGLGFVTVVVVLVSIVNSTKRNAINCAFANSLTKFSLHVWMLLLVIVFVFFFSFVRHRFINQADSLNSTHFEIYDSNTK